MLLTNIKNRSGFTLIEVIVAIFILTIGVMGAYAVVQQIIASTSITSSRLVAAYLAQEGIEIVRNIRDSNWLAGDSWDEGITGCGPSPAGCEADYKVDTPQEDLPLTFCPAPCNYDDLRSLNIEGNGFYSYSPGTPTKFKRKITITPDGTHILKVSVQIEWPERGKIHQVIAQENLYKWR